MVQCKLCGYKFDETKIEPCTHCFACGGNMVPCPNCGYEVPRKKSKQINKKTSTLNSIIQKLKV